MMIPNRLLVLFVPSLVCGPMVQAELKVLDKPLWIFPGQQFRVCLEQPAGAGKLTVTASATLEMFDQWDQDAIQRYYFRSLRAGDATLRFSGKGGELEMKLEVLPWPEVFRGRKYKNVKLPRLWPMDDPAYDQLKSQRTMHTQGELEQIREEGKVTERAKRWLETTDEQIFNIIPGPSVPRTCLIVLGSLEGGGIGKGCPVCGTKIYDGRNGFYPWQYNAKPQDWKVRCPECKTAFPSNDWRNGDMHSGDFPDDGFGCEPRTPVKDAKGRSWRWPFIAYYHQWAAYMKEFTPGIIETARASVATGDKAYAHKCAVALLRYAEAMVDMSLNLNHRKRVNRDGVYNWPVGAPIAKRFHVLSGSFSYIQPNWDTGRMENCARAWDMIFGQLDDDAELIAFAQANHHPEIKTFRDFRRFVEAGIIRAPLQMGLDNAVARNWPQQELMVANVALCLGTERTTEVADWLLNVNGIRFALTNLFYKDGAAYESPSYNHGHISRTASISVALKRLQALYSEQCRPPRFVSVVDDPKFRRLYDFPLEAGLIGRTTPYVGDAGKGGASNVLAERQGYPCDLKDWTTAYKATGDPRFAQAMYGPGGRLAASIADPDLKAAALAVGESLGWQVKMRSNLLDGYGFAVLRSGLGSEQRAVWMRYARNLQHTHSDMLSYGIAGLRRDLLPELGYPEGWTFSGRWESNWGTHYGTKITGLRTTNFSKAELTTLSGQPPVQVAAAESFAKLDGQVCTRQRLIALVDTSPQDFYVLTLERVQGGTEHTFSFHGPDGEATPQNVQLEPYEGTALGPGTKYCDFSSVTDSELSCLAMLQDPQRAAPQGGWGLDYALRKQPDVHLHMTSVCPAGGELIVAKGRPPAGRKLYDMTWAILKSRGDSPLTKQYLNIIEPYEGTRVVRSIDRLPVQTGAGTAQFAPLAVRITTDSFVDTVLMQHEPGREMVAGGVRFDGEFGLWRERDGKFHTAALVRGTTLMKGQHGITLPAAEYTGEIASCDWSSRTIVISPRPAAIPAPGRHLRITNADGSSASYQIKDAEFVENACRITFDIDPRIGEGFVEDCQGATVRSATHLKLYRYDYYAGKTLANETGSVLYRLQNVKGGRDCVISTDTKEKLNTARLREEFADLDGDGLRRFVIYDYGPGDKVSMENYGVLTSR